MEHYKSWLGLKKQLEDTLCDELRGKITYFLTRYHSVHNAYGCAAILKDGKELVCFSWIAMCTQENEAVEAYKKQTKLTYDELWDSMRPHWNENCTWYEGDFLKAALQFRNLPIAEALASENAILRILAILDRRVGKRKLEQIQKDGSYLSYPHWVRQFYELRFAYLSK